MTFSPVHAHTHAHTQVEERTWQSCPLAQSASGGPEASTGFFDPRAQLMKLLCCHCQVELDTLEQHSPPLETTSDRVGAELKM